MDEKLCRIELTAKDHKIKQLEQEKKELKEKLEVAEEALEKNIQSFQNDVVSTNQFYCPKQICKNPPVIPRSGFILKSKSS